MKYLYSKEMCSACEAREKELNASSVNFIQRNGDRLGLDPRIFDDIDREAFFLFQTQNSSFPVEVDTVG